MSISDELQNFAKTLDNGDFPDGDAMEYLWDIVGRVDKLERENKRLTALQAEATFIMSEPVRGTCFFELGDALCVDGYDDCIIGLVTHPTQRLVYDQDQIIMALAIDMSMEEAQEYFAYNIEGAYMGENTPIFMERVRRMEPHYCQICGNTLEEEK